MCFKIDRFVRYYVKKDSCVYHSAAPIWMDPLHERRSRQNLPQTAICYQIFKLYGYVWKPAIVRSVQQDTCSCVTPPHCTRLSFFQLLSLLWSEAMFVKWFWGGSLLDSWRWQWENGCPLAEPAGGVGTTLGTSLWIHSLSSSLFVCDGGLCEF